MKIVFHLLWCLIVGLGIASCDSPDTAKKKKKPQTKHLVEVVVVEDKRSGVSRVRTGTLRARREIKIYTQETGQITQLPFFEGDRVEKGDLVARLDDRLLQAQYNRVLASRNKAQQDFVRTKELYRKKLVSAEELNRVETELELARADAEVLQTRLGYAQIKAPIGGLISERKTEPGNVVERFAHILTIADPGSLLTEVTVSELLLPLLSKGDTVKVRIDALGSELFDGSILRIHPSLDPISRRGTVEVELQSVPKGASPGQLCRVHLNAQATQRRVIPFAALRRDSRGEYVFLLDPSSDQVKRQTVRSGLRIAERIEVLEGLRAGDMVVSKGFLGLSNGKKVHVVSGSRQPRNNDSSSKPNP